MAVEVAAGWETLGIMPQLELAEECVSDTSAQGSRTGWAPVTPAPSAIAITSMPTVWTSPRPTAGTAVTGHRDIGLGADRRRR